MIRIVGSFVSPYVRKVLACMNLKGLRYEIDPITPFYGNDEFERMSPLRRIPVLIDGDFSVSDSSVICAYLDEAYPGHPLFPADPKDRARARWLEEFADTRLGDVFIWSLFYQKIVHPLVWAEPGDQQRIDKSTSRPRSSSLSASFPQTAAFSATSALPTSRSPASS
jgi:glutathione S-transferase